jgi:hypothetical protein
VALVALVGVATGIPDFAHARSAATPRVPNAQTTSRDPVSGSSPGDVPLFQRGERPSLTPAARTAILVAIDGVRWQEVYGGVESRAAARHGLSSSEVVDAAHLVPHLHRLMTVYGAAVGAPGDGAPMEASGPNFVSLPGYMEMLTGRRDTGCTDNYCARVRFPTVADDVGRANLGAAVAITSWESIDLAATSSPGHVFVSAGRHGGTGRAALAGHPVVGPLMRAAESVRPNPGNDDFRPDAYTANVALAVLESVRPAFLFVGLGETDEYAHADDYRSYLRALRAADVAIGNLADAAQRATAAGHPTTLFITTDHGRQSDFVSHGSAYPESARVWLIAAGAGIEARGAISSHTVRHLADVAPTIRQLIGVPPADIARTGDVIGELFERSKIAIHEKGDPDDLEASTH